VVALVCFPLLPFANVACEPPPHASLAYCGDVVSPPGACSAFVWYRALVVVRANPNHPSRQLTKRPYRVLLDLTLRRPGAAVACTIDTRVTYEGEDVLVVGCSDGMVNVFNDVSVVECDSVEASLGACVACAALFLLAVLPPLLLPPPVLHLQVRCVSPSCSWPYRSGGVHTLADSPPNETSEPTQPRANAHLHGTHPHTGVSHTTRHTGQGFVNVLQSSVAATAALKPVHAIAVLSPLLPSRSPAAAAGHAAAPRRRPSFGVAAADATTTRASSASSSSSSDDWATSTITGVRWCRGAMLLITAGASLYRVSAGPRSSKRTSSAAAAAASSGRGRGGVDSESESGPAHVVEEDEEAEAPHQRSGSTFNKVDFDADIVAFSFGADADKGVVSTARGTLWFVEWSVGSLVRLTSSHASGASPSSSSSS
jgi:hypothetical protein